MKPKNDMMYQDICNCPCQNTKNMKIYRWHHVESDILQEGPGAKHPGRWEIAERQIHSIKMLLKQIPKVTSILVLDYLSFKKMYDVLQLISTDGNVAIEDALLVIPGRTLTDGRRT